MNEHRTYTVRWKVTCKIVDLHREKKKDPNQHASLRHVPSKDGMMQMRAKFGEIFTDRDRQNLQKVT